MTGRPNWPNHRNSITRPSEGLHHCPYSRYMRCFAESAGDSIRCAALENGMRKKKIGVLFGMEDSFPWALINAINERGGDTVEGSAMEISYLKDDGVFPYDLILDRISHEVPF